MMKRIETTGGLIQGIEVDGGLAFLGIPYAIANRYERCRPYMWDGVKSVSSFGEVAPQLDDRQPIGSEECLTLNIYTPNTKGAYPVLVEIHGGAFQMGSNQSMTRSISQGQPMVHIGINYRLGVFGFLSMGVVDLDHEDGIDSGNLGIDDQQAALRWIYENCRRFGGDPHRITVMGNSAGGKSIGAQLVAGKYKHRIHGAILSSGAMQSIRDLTTARRLGDEFGQVILALYGKPKQEKDNKGNDTIHPVNLAHDWDWRHLVRELSTEELLEAQRQWCENRQSTCFFGPVADGMLIHTDWMDASKDGIGYPKRLMVGSNSHECVFYKEDTKLEEHRQKIMDDLFGMHGVLVEKAYQQLLSMEKGVSPVDILIDCLSDYMYGLHTHQLALDGYSESDVYYYRFGFGNGAHALDMRLLSRDPALMEEYPFQEDTIHLLQESMLQAYRNFIGGDEPFQRFDGTMETVCYWGFSKEEDIIQRTYRTMDSRMRQVICR